MIGTAEERLRELDELYPVWEEDTLWTRFRKNAERFAETEFLVFEDCSYTYEETLCEVEQMANRLYNIGIKPGDHVCLFMKNCPEYIFLIFALSKVGAVEVAGNIRISAQELQHALVQSDSVCVISNVLLPLPLPKLNMLKRAVVLDEDKIHFQEEQAVSWDRFTELGKICVSDDLLDQSEKSQNPKAMSAIFFTSGSSSLPKGVIIRHDMVLRSAYGTCRCRCMERGRRSFVPLPLFHMRGFVEGVLALMMVGGTVILSRERFSAIHTLEMLQKFHANDLICLSPMMVTILSKNEIHSEDYPDLHSGSWSATCPEWVWSAAREAFGIQDVTTSYGMTETGSSFTMVHSDDPLDVVEHCHGRLKRAGSAAAPGLKDVLNEMKICDLETGEEALPGTVGELCFRGLTITDGYYNNAKATAAAFSSDGWFRSGDKGIADENGYFIFLGRIDDMYKINGENVSPKYLDDVISRCPLVNAVETVGVYHAKYGAVGVAFIDAKDTKEETKEEIQKYMTENLACFQVPKYCFYSDSSTWPRTGTGKITKKGLRMVAEEKIAVWKGE